MFDDGHDETEASRFSRMLRDPVKLRRRARLAGVLLTMAVAVAGEGLSARIPGLVFPLLWLALPPVALAIGYGDAFFVEHDVGTRRVLVTLVLGVLVSLASCVIISTAAGVEDGVVARVLAAGLYGLLYGGLLVALSSIVGLGLGRGFGYAGRHIQEFDDENW